MIRNNIRYFLPIALAALLSACGKDKDIPPTPSFISAFVNGVDGGGPQWIDYNHPEEGGGFSALPEMQWVWSVSSDNQSS